MNKGLLLAALCTLAVTALAAPPVFPLDWTSIEEDFMIVYQGQYNQIGDNYCCSDDNCEVQTQFQSGHNYFDFTHNRTRFDDPNQGSIVSLFAPIYKEMAVDGTNTCTSYCQIQDDLEAYQIDPNATDEGPKVVDNRTLEDWQSKEMLGPIVMEIDDIYVDMTKSPPVPYVEIDQLTPFGEPIGESTSTYLAFQAGTPDPSHFAIKGVDTCPVDNNCGNSARQQLRQRWGMKKTWLKYYQEANIQKAKMTKPRSRPSRPVRK